ncbi:MAG: selenium metabolism-associated LysR family transcriptional regulator [Desulfonatronovibrio sp.]|nr:LysR family transcriptional regulator [Desulfovibrionales bacterium]
MDFRKLQAFSKVYELQSFSKAAKDLFLSQPTISTHVQSLESDLGVKLFDRIGRKVIATQAGQALYAGVFKVFRTLDETRSDIHDLKNQVSGTVLVGGSTIPSNYLLPSVLSSFRRKYPHVRVDLKIGDSSKVCQAVLAGDLDFGIVGGFADHFDLDHSHLLNDSMCIIYSSHLGQKIPDSVKPEYLLEIPWVLREKGSGTRQALEMGLMENKISFQDLQIATMVESTETLVRCVLSGTGVGMTSMLAVNEYIDSDDLKILNVKGLEFKRNFYVIKHKRRTLFTCAQRLIETIYSHVVNNGYAIPIVPGQ